MKYHSCTINKGELIMNRQEFKRQLKFMRDGHYVMVLISMENDRDEREWQKWYRVLLKEMAMDTGNSPQEMHEFAKADILSEMGFTSTTELTPVLWKEYVEKLGDWSLEKFDFVI